MIRMRTWEHLLALTTVGLFILSVTVGLENFAIVLVLAISAFLYALFNVYDGDDGLVGWLLVGMAMIGFLMVLKGDA